MNKIRIRLIILVLSLIGVISLMTLTINGEVKNINSLSENYKDKLIRFHVIANSDSDEDQELKLKVRDAVIEYLQPKLSKSKNISQSEEIIKNEYDQIEKISENIIKENGYTYDIKVGIEYSNFPTKQYSSVVLPAGEYKALKIVIGEGTGKNWWCVMFPPLCFIDEENGVIDKATDEKLKEVLTEEEYNLITHKTKEEVSRVEVKFKIAEIIDSILKN
ncbi:MULTISPECIES: stage II sporulation protein R [Romboutsia]|uniref:Stage II sporulation protein R n=1 Tax=Romboutsia hominis TaxID=1507512 RepID=A0A2P2BYK9_9FIRM|nr:MULTISPECIES: stage II sporulation protein R [Romboutsia]MCH1958953.1 stage II sporulation protein R [Romboutsia hominis]MCH1968080.1 stage II sporulation protein R [Romboutsia hominis]MDB8790493.1 stage II sporulation protein R [Romboutsia sp. 1001216sp1]MDB8793942.1 stage II sporulation protein R [Romboutsia sp. 1001216sp1]MDB8796869.1 stage II sporulation protein R [Romboutsia sp. 1001216sp1]